MYWAVYVKDEIKKIIITPDKDMIRRGKEIPAYSNVHGAGVFREFVVIFKDEEGCLMALATSNKESHTLNVCDILNAGLETIYIHSQPSN